MRIFVAVSFFFSCLFHLTWFAWTCHFLCLSFFASSISLSLSRSIRNIVGVFLLKDFFVCSHARKTKQNEKLNGILTLPRGLNSKRKKKKKTITTQFVTETFSLSILWQKSVCTFFLCLYFCSTLCCLVFLSLFFSIAKNNKPVIFFSISILFSVTLAKKLLCEKKCEWKTCHR